MADQKLVDSKSPFQSFGVNGALVAIVSFLLHKAGYAGVDAGELINGIMEIVTAVGVVVGAVTALWGRVRATKRIG